MPAGRASAANDWLQLAYRVCDTQRHPALPAAACSSCRFRRPHCSLNDNNLTGTLPEVGSAKRRGLIGQQPAHPAAHACSA